ncbi:hypothetical protein ACWD4L_45260 [Streptomyces sp. NPDC002596]
MRRSVESTVNTTGAIIWLLEGKVVGTSTFRVTTIGQGTQGSRVIRLETQLDNWVNVGYQNPTVQLPVRVTTSGYSGTDGSNPACIVTANGNPATQAQWQMGTSGIYTISSAQADGYGQDAISRCTFKQE